MHLCLELVSSLVAVTTALVLLNLVVKYKPNILLSVCLEVATMLTSVMGHLGLGLIQGLQYYERVLSGIVHDTRLNFI